MFFFADSVKGWLECTVGFSLDEILAQVDSQASPSPEPAPPTRAVLLLLLLLRLVGMLGTRLRGRSSL